MQTQLAIGMEIRLHAARVNEPDRPIYCAVCGGSTFTETKVLWPELIEARELSPEEVAYIDRREGRRCDGCGSSLRSIALAKALCHAFGTELGLAEFVSSQRAARWRVLEINEAGTLTPILAKMPGHELAKFPDVDLQALPFAENSCDIVVHSETLEHVPDPVRALKECYRVLAPGGAVCFTIPIIGARLTRSRRGMPNSYHGNSAETSDDLLVRTEYGADAWISVMQAGFAQLSISAVELPASIAFSGWKPVRSPNAGNHRQPYTGGPMGRLVLRAVGHPIRSRIGTRGLVWRLRAKLRT